NATALKWLDSKCNNLSGCPKWLISYFNIEPDLSIIGNVSKSIGILLLNGENDSQTPVQQAFLLQQRLTNVNHPDHMLIACFNCAMFYTVESRDLLMIGLAKMGESCSKVAGFLTGIR
ncbi:MAG: hypothetical protein WA364_01885, partial [Candidatus Nitrosopolaris sp.]